MTSVPHNGRLTLNHQFWFTPEQCTAPLTASRSLNVVLMLWTASVMRFQWSEQFRQLQV